MSFQKLAIEKDTGDVYGPATMKAMAEAFDKAWNEIGRFYSQHPLQEEIYRARLAQAVLKSTKPNSTSAEDIAMKALANFP